MLGGQQGGSEAGESLLIMSDFGQTKNHCFLEDFKLVRNNEGMVSIMQTKVAIVLRYDNTV